MRRPLVLPILHAQAQRYGNEIAIDLVATPTSYAWFISGTDPNSGWGRLRSFNSSVAQAIQGLIEATAALPQARMRVSLKISSKALLNAMREGKNPSRRLGGLMRSLRQQMAGHSVEVDHFDEADQDYKDKLAVLVGAEGAGVLPVAIAGDGLMKFSDYNGIKAAPALPSELRLVRKTLPVVELTYERSGSIRAIRFDDAGNRFPPLQRPAAVPMVLDQITACADQGHDGDLLASIETRTTALTIAQVAELFGVSGETIRRMAAKKQIPGFRIGGSVRFNPASLGYWLRQRDQVAAKASKKRAVTSGADYAPADRSSVEGVA